MIASGEESKTITRRNLLAKVDQIGEEDGPGFHLSFTDLMALLLVFFVLFFSMTKSGNDLDGDLGIEAVNRVTKAVVNDGYEAKVLEEKKEGLFMRLVSAAPAWADGLVNNEVESRQRALDSLSSNLLGGSSSKLPAGQLNGDRQSLLNHLAGSSQPTGASLIAEPRKKTKAIKIRKNVKRDLLMVRMKKLKQAMPGFDLAIRANSESVVLTIGDRVTFEEGRAEVKPQFRKMLIRLSKSLIANPGLKAVKIKGHTDSKPISNPIFPSNWELSGARAARVARTLIHQGLPPQLFEVVGYSEFRPVAGNDKAEARAKNRRVEIELVTG